MLRKRSRGVSSKQAIVAEQSNNQPWLFLEKPRKPTSFFKGFFTFSSQTSEPIIMTPTSILDSTKAFSALANSIWVVDGKKLSKTPEKLSENKPTGIGLALVDENLENISKTQKQKPKLVVFGSQLRIQIPNSSVFPCFSPESPGEFGIKTPRSAKLSSRVSQIHPEEISESILMSEIEQSEDYTCVISHGPNPKTTHIFGNCIVGSCCGVVGSSSFSSRRNGLSSPASNPITSPENFLSFCHHCRKKLGHGNDIYMYRGEKAFCSEECRCEGMLFDGEES